MGTYEVVKNLLFRQDGEQNPKLIQYNMQKEKFKV